MRPPLNDNLLLWTCGVPDVPALLFDRLVSCYGLSGLYHEHIVAYILYEHGQSWCMIFGPISTRRAPFSDPSAVVAEKLDR